MNRLSIIIFFLTLFGFLTFSNQKSISYSWTERNGVRTYSYDGKQYNSMDEVMAEIRRQHPNVIFGPVSTGEGGSIGGYGRPSGSIGGHRGPGGSIGGYREPGGSIGGYGRPGGSIGGYGRPGGSFGGHGRPTGSMGGWTGGFDISKYKGNNPFSNQIFDEIWKDYNYDQDSKQGFRDMKKRFLDETNRYRKAHHVDPLTLNSTLEAKAQKYADELAKIGKLVHDPKNHEEKTGENLAFGSPAISHLGVKKWYDEIEHYNFDKPGFSSATGHFTQLVWKNSKNAGFGVAVSPKGVFVVCKYSPPGNYNNDYDKNVLRQ